MPGHPLRALFVTLLLAAAAAHTVAKAPAKAAQWQRLASEFSGELRAAAVPAAALVLVVDGEVALLRTWGDITPATPFRVGSITKTFTALAALAAAEAHDIPLDAPVANWLPAHTFTNPWAAQAPLRFAHLFELAAGVADLSGREFDSAVPLPLGAALQLDAPRHVAHWPPGLAHSYSNLPPGFTAAVVEHLTGMPFARWLETRVLKPLGLPGASLDALPGLPGGFRADGRTPIPYWHTLFPAFGGLNVPTNEFAQFLARLARGDLGPLASAVARRQVAGAPVALWEPAATLGAALGLELGYGVGTYGSVRDGHLLYGHGGDADGYRSRYGVFPAYRRGYYLAINTDNPRLLGRLRAHAERALIADLPLPPTPPARSITAAAAAHFDASYAGLYYPAARRFGVAAWRACEAQALRVGRDAAGVWTERRERRTRLHWLGAAAGNALRFRRTGDPITSLIFTRYNRRTYLLGEFGPWVRLPADGNCRSVLEPPPATLHEAEPADDNGPWTTPRP